MDTEGRALDGFDELKVTLGVFGHCPAHDFQRELGSFGFHGVDYAATVLYRGVEELLREIVFMWTVPDFGIEAAGDVDAAAGANGVGEGHAAGDVIEIGLAGYRIGVEHVFPGADFGDQDIFGLECGFDGSGVIQFRGGTVGGGVAETAVLAGEFARVV